MVVRKTGKACPRSPDGGFKLGATKDTGRGGLAHEKATTALRTANRRVTLPGGVTYDATTGKLMPSGECPPDFEEAGE